MRKISLLIGAFAFISMSAFAQYNISRTSKSEAYNLSPIKTKPSMNTKAAGDTAGIAEYVGLNGQSGNTIYSGGKIKGNSGYYAGTSWNDSSGLAGVEQGDFVGYLNAPVIYGLSNNGYLVTEIIGSAIHAIPNPANSSNFTSSLTGSVFLIDDTITISDGNKQTIYQGPVPGTKLASGTLDMNNLDTAYHPNEYGLPLFKIQLNTPAHIAFPGQGLDWGVAINWSDLYPHGDTIGMVIMSNSSSGGGKLAAIPSYTQDDMWFLKFKNNQNDLFWFPINQYLSSNNTAVNYLPAIFAVLDNDPNAGIDELSSTYDNNGLRMYNAPNPSHGNTEINYSLINSGYAQLKVIDAQGRMVYQEEGMKQGGIMNKVKFNRGDLTPGIYFYTLYSHNKTLTMKMVIAE